jgi:hypothetical protein
MEVEVEEVELLDLEQLFSWREVLKEVCKYLLSEVTKGLRLSKDTSGNISCAHLTKVKKY